MTKKPAVTLENHAEVYDFYRQSPPNPRMTMLGQAGMSYIMRPHFFSLPGTLDRLKEHASNGGQLLIIGNHVKGIDPLIVSVMQARVPALEFTRRKTSGVVKISLLRDANPELSLRGLKSLANPVVRWGVEQMRSIPAFREKDNADEDEATPTDRRKLLASAGAGLMNLVAYRLDAGEHIAMYPEGERNKQDPLVVQDFMPGAAFIASRDKSGNLAVQTFGTYYGENTFRPTVVLGDFIDPHSMNRKALNKVMHESVQNAVTIAHQLHTNQ